MYKDLLDKARELMGLAKEASMATQSDFEMDQQAKLFSLLRELDQVNVNIGHTQYMVSHFEKVWRSTDIIQVFTSNHQAMMLACQHLTELRTRRDELEGHINFLRTSL